MTRYADGYNRPGPLVALSAGGLSVLALAALGGGLALAVAVWPWGVIGLLAGVAFAVPVMTYVSVDLGELRDAFWSRSERRRLLLSQLEEGANVLPAKPLPAPILVKGAAVHPESVKAYAGDGGQDDGDDVGLEALNDVLDVIDDAGGRLAWPVLSQHGLDRTAYDWALNSETGVLAVMGLTDGRRPGAEGRLLYDVPTAKKLASTAWRLSRNGAKLLVGANVNE